MEIVRQDDGVVRVRGDLRIGEAEELRSERPRGYRNDANPWGDFSAM
jgi:hypothetical protein